MTPPVTCPLLLLGSIKFKLFKIKNQENKLYHYFYIDFPPPTPKIKQSRQLHKTLELSICLSLLFILPIHFFHERKQSKSYNARTVVP